MAASFAISTVLCMIFTFGGRLFIRIYTSDEQAIEFAIIRMWCVLLPGMLTCLYEIAGGALRGTGYSLLPAIITLAGSCGLRIVWIYTLFRAFPDKFWLLMIVYPISWLITGIVMLIAYFVISRRKYKQNAQNEAEDSANRPENEPETT